MRRLTRACLRGRETLAGTRWEEEGVGRVRVRRQRRRRLGHHRKGADPWAEAIRPSWADVSGAWRATEAAERVARSAEPVAAQPQPILRLIGTARSRGVCRPDSCAPKQRTRFDYTSCSPEWPLNRAYYCQHLPLDLPPRPLEGAHSALIADGGHIKLTSYLEW